MKLVEMYENLQSMGVLGKPLELRAMQTFGFDDVGCLSACTTTPYPSHEQSNEGVLKNAKLGTSPSGN